MGKPLGAVVSFGVSVAAGDVGGGVWVGGVVVGGGVGVVSLPGVAVTAMVLYSVNAGMYRMSVLFSPSYKATQP